MSFPFVTEMTVTVMTLLNAELSCLSTEDWDIHNLRGILEQFLVSMNRDKRICAMTILQLIMAHTEMTDLKYTQ